MRILLLFLTAFAPFAQGQNLVVNGGFERKKSADAGSGNAQPRPCQFTSAASFWNNNALGWQTFDLQTPDFLVWDSTVTCPLFPQPHKGKKMAGLILYHPQSDGGTVTDYHEMIQGTLGKPLEKGKTYEISFYAFVNDSLGPAHLNAVFGRSASAVPVYCGNFGFYFSKDPIRPKEDFMASQAEFPVKPQVNWSPIIYGQDAWQKITMSFVADQEYKYFLFGNFYKDSETPVNMSLETRLTLDSENQQQQFWARKKRIGYYLFDDFSLTLQDNSLEKTLLTEKKYVFQSALVFDSGKADLKTESQPMLDELAVVLTKNPGMRVEIGGHTDDTGDENTNFSLSEARALAIYKALTAKKVNAAQLRWKGYGESQPCDNNSSEAGRQKNRRVEIRVY